MTPPLLRLRLVLFVMLSKPQEGRPVLYTVSPNLADYLLVLSQSQTSECTLLVLDRRCGNRFGQAHSARIVELLSHFPVRFTVSEEVARSTLVR